MILQTSRFGQIEYQKDHVYLFPHGIPGFQNLKQYLFIQTEDEVIAYLQSVDDGEISFIVTSPFAFYPDYDFELSDAAVEELQITAPEEVTVLSIMSIKDSLETATINLVAPIVLNAEKKLGKQVILSQTAYTTKHSLIRERSEQRP